MTFPCGAGPTGIAAADFNGDGKLDLVVAIDGLAILLGNGDGTFQPFVQIPNTSGTAITVADFNGDGIPDLAAANEFGETYSVSIGHGDGTFAAPRVFWTASNSIPNSITAADFNSDGSQDIAVAGQEGLVTVLLDEPALAISYPSLNFGSQVVATTSSPLPIIITNMGGTRLNISKLAIGANFAETDNCVGTIAIGAHCTVNITFTPPQTGNIIGTLTITDNNSGVAGSTQTVALSRYGCATTRFQYWCRNRFAIECDRWAPRSHCHILFECCFAERFRSARCAHLLDSNLQGYLRLCSPTSANPTGATPASVTVTVSTTAPSLVLPLGPDSHQKWPLFLLVGGVCTPRAGRITGGFYFIRRPTRHSLLSVRPLPLEGWPSVHLSWQRSLLRHAAVAEIRQGGGGNSNPGTPAGTYSITVNGTSGSLTHSVGSYAHS